jgi:hypothetical protein
MMRSKIFVLVYALLIVSIAIALIPIDPFRVKAQSIILSLKPESTIGPPPDLGETLTLKLHVADVSNLWSWKVQITWDPVVLSLASSPVEGPFLKSAGATLFLVMPPTPGEIGEMSSTLLSRVSANGSGDLASLTFAVVSYGMTNINLTSTVLKDPTVEHNEIPHTAIGATFQLAQPPSTSPVAAFMPENLTSFVVGDTMYLDAQPSAGGYDTMPAGDETACPIANFTWQIDVGSDGSVDITLEGINGSFVCAAQGEIAVNLTVYAPDPVPPSHEDYVEYDSTVHLFFVQERLNNSRIDVYTDQGGEYPEDSGGAYGPQQLVSIYALVTYEDAPLANQYVAFEILNNNITMAYRTGLTNAQGIATTEFRLPWTENPEELFGMWTLIGVAEVAQTIINDTCSFTYGLAVYIVTAQIMDHLNQPAQLFTPGQTARINVTITNTQETPLETAVAVTLFDEASVPIGAAYVIIVVPAQTTTSEVVDLNIPTWAFAGAATAYVNAFTQLPQDLGVPYCPEHEVQFTINP